LARGELDLLIALEVKKNPNMKTVLGGGNSFIEVTINIGILGFSGSKYP